MKFAFHRHSHRVGVTCRRLALTAAAVVGLGLGLGSAANATDYSGPFSGSGLAPSPLSFSLGDNDVSGATGGFVSSYMTFTIAPGDELSSIVVLDTSTAPDRTFFGIASGETVVVDPSFTSAKGLIGWTLIDSTMDGENVLGDLGAAAPPNFPAIPGATGFTPPLGAGTYSTWIVDGDNTAGAVPFKLNFVVSSAPEPSAWVLMLVGVGLTGAALRRRSRQGFATA